MQPKSEPNNSFVLILAICALVASAVYIWRFTQGPFDKYALWQKELGPVAQKAAKAVVAIETDQKVRRRVVLEKNAGSGFIIDTKGYIVTNEHVVHGAQTIYVTLADKRRFFGRLIAGDPRSDIALIKIDADNLHVLPFGKTDDLAPGQVVITLGNSLGTGADGKAVVTFGRITRLNQRLSPEIDQQNDRFYDNLIQTDAITEPGNSGGPLIDEHGGVIGLLTAMGSSVDSAERFGFAIALDGKNLRIIDQLKQSKLVQHAFLGVLTDRVDEAASKRLDIKDVSGALVAEVLLGSPAQISDIQIGDVIRGLDGARIYSPIDLISQISRSEPGRRMDVDILRGSKGRSEKFSVGVTLAVRTLTDRNGYMEEAALKGKTVWGMQVKPLTNWRRGKLGIGLNHPGVVVYRVEPGTESYRRGIKAGFVVTGVAKYKVDNLTDFAILAEKYQFLPQIETVKPRAAMY